MTYNVLKGGTQTINFIAFISVFSYESWILIGVTVVVLAISMFGLSQSLKESFHEDSERFKLSNAFGYVYVAFLQLDYPIIKVCYAVQYINMNHRIYNV